jgi:diguanylate cyclase (GGDEF)-like protein/PAS domain S-box-containing protein
MPFAARGRGTVVSILVTFALFSLVSVGLSIRATARSQHRATVVEVAARQRTLAQRYVNDVLLVRAGQQADPATTAKLLVASAHALLMGGEAPPVDGDDDETELSAAGSAVVRRQLEQERRLVGDLTRTGAAVLARAPVSAVALTAREHPDTTDAIGRLRILADLTSNVSLNAARTIAANADRNIGSLITTQVLLGAIGLLTSLLLAGGLVAATRRQTAHFRSLVSSSTDLVLVFGAGGCKYASRSVGATLGCPESRLLGDGFARFVHRDDQASVVAASEQGELHPIEFRVVNRFDEIRHLEAHVTDLRGDRHVRGVVLNARDITERVRLEQELTHQAFHDSLTGLANRALFRDRLDQALARSARSLEPLAVLLIDLDGFKQINDTLGHDAGDDVIQMVAARFAAAGRPSDTVARFGGDEFAVLLEGAGEPQAVGVAERLMERLTQALAVSGRELALGASIGIVLHPGGPGASDDLIREADVAMYAAKESGRGRYEIFRHEMAREVGELLGLEHELRLGIQRGELSVHFQPEVAVEGGAVVGVEALLRWRSPTRGDISPGQFIPIAEATGLILPLGEFVLREACAQTARWGAAGLLGAGFVTWVNLSGKQLNAGGVVTLVRAVLAEHGLPPERLGLEVTESTIVQEGAAGERAQVELQELHDLGVHIALDDFGTGFSSLGQLRHFPIDMLKVDRSFIQGIAHDAKDAAITSNLVSLAHALGLLAIAEGIESEAQLGAIRALGCDLAQGYLFARPAPADDVTALLAAAATPPPARRRQPAGAGRSPAGARRGRPSTALTRPASG